MGERRFTRRHALVALAGTGAAVVGARLALPWFLRARPMRRVEELSPGARALVEAAFEGVDPALCWDNHVHVVGLGAGGTGCWVNPAMQSHWNVVQKLQFDLYLAASGIDDRARADERYLERLFELHRAANPQGKLMLMAFDRHVGEDGEVREELSNFHTPNEYVLALAARHEDALAVGSVHPYRRDAVERLERLAEGGAVAIKWLPNAMGIDPASERCDAFYEKLAELGLPLVSHAGVEKAVHAEEHQELGNPLRLRRALDAGVRVVVAHCASLGTSVDLDAGEDGGSVPSFELFLRLMGEERYRGLVFGEVSAITLANRAGDPLRRLLSRTDLHPRLVNGSDYPLIAIDPVISLRLLVRQGVLDPAERAPLAELFEANPLLFDFVHKRRLRVLDGGERRAFAPSVFESARVFDTA